MCDGAIELDPFRVDACVAQQTIDSLDAVLGRGARDRTPETGERKPARPQERVDRHEHQADAGKVNPL
jgi:hypothetical protein